MPYEIAKRGDKYCVVKQDDGKEIGCHPSEKEAKDQMAAIYANENKELYGIPKRDPLLFNRGKQGITIYKSADGARYMFLVTSNSYEDREQETITTKALQDYVDSAWRVEGKCLPRNPLAFWHEKNNKADIGDIIWTDMQGAFLLEVAKERSNKPITITTRKGIWHTTIKALWDAIELATEKGIIKWGASHGFKYPTDAFENGTYKEIRKFETSVLPLDAAANALTFAGVVNDMNKDAVLEKLIALPGMAAKFRKGVKEAQDELEKRGVEHKQLDAAKTKGMLDKLGDKIDALITQIFDQAPPDLKSQILQAVVSVLASEPTETVDDMATEETAMNYDNAANEAAGKQLKVYETMLKGIESILDERQDIRKENDATRTALTEINKALQPLATLPEVVRGFDGRLSGFDERLKAVEKRLSGAPRQASQAESTTVTDKELTDKAKEALDGFVEAWPGSGMMIKKSPASNGKGT